MDDDHRYILAVLTGDKQNMRKKTSNSVVDIDRVQIVVHSVNEAKENNRISIS